MTDLLETTEDGIAWLTLNRPDRLNAFSPGMLTALGEALQRLSGDAAVGAVVMTGAGRGFCAGGDVKTMPSRAAQGFEERVEGLRRMHQLPLLLRTMPKVVIAMMNGPAVGAGLSGDGLRSAYRRTLGPLRNRLRRGRLFRRFRRLVDLDPARWHGKGARALLPRRDYRHRGGALARLGEPRRRGRGTARRDYGPRPAHRRRTPNRLRLHEAQSVCRGDRAACCGSRNGGGAAGACRNDRGPPRSRSRLRRETPPGVQGEMISAHQNSRSAELILC